MSVQEKRRSDQEDRLSGQVQERNRTRKAAPFLALANAPQWAGDMFVGIVLIASLALTGLQRRTTAGRRG